MQGKSIGNMARYEGISEATIRRLSSYYRILEEVLRVFRRVRDQIKARLARFVEDEAKAECSADESTERRELQDE